MKIKNVMMLQFAWVAMFPVFARQVDGNYNVPVTETDLVDSSNYNTRYNVSKRNGEVRRMKYNLPLELTGELNEVILRKTNNVDYPWQGENAKGDCSDVSGSFECQLTYTKEKLLLDPVKTEQQIRNKFAGNEHEIQRRLQVAETFRSEPAGVTSFPLE